MNQDQEQEGSLVVSLRSLLFCTPFQCREGGLNTAGDNECAEV